VHGVVRFAQESSGQQECSIEVVVDGLAPGAHGWSVHEFGDLTRGPLSTGAAYAFPPPRNSSISVRPAQICTSFFFHIPIL
jgi:Cu/Zn superoxide dismutase